MGHIRSILLAFSILVSVRATAQNSDLGNWLIYIGNTKVGERWDLHSEVQYRNYNFIGDLEQLLIRTGIGYNLSENNNNVLLGYGYIRSDNYVAGSEDKLTINEHRIFEQFITRQKLGRYGLMHRFRFEQRFIEEDFRMRFRYFIAATMALTRPTLEANTLYLSAYNEIFLNTESPVFDRNRLYGGLGWKFSAAVRAELGYMVQFFDDSSRDQLNMFVYLNF